MPKHKRNLFAKQAFELMFVLMLLPLTLPLMCLIALAIWIETSGNILYIQPRLGRNKKLFPCLKFRTMYQQSDQILQEYLAKHPSANEEWQKFKKLRNFDPRVTHVGKILRKTSLDELPQILNVLVGQMSLVGPRPYINTEQTAMGTALDDIVSVKPGMTGLWQVSGRNNLSFQQRIALDREYALHGSFWMDIKILFKTVYVVITAEGAY